ncbi:MAG: hypothetical protein MMC33_006286 [Icmadophila ericetorum]|nr:hypothetical protein [Icmadophila ericetorum]
MTDPNWHIETPRLYISYFIPSNPAHRQFLYELYNTPLFISAEGQTGIISPSKAQDLLSGPFVEQHKRNGYGQYLVSLKPRDSESESESKSRSFSHTDSKPIGSVSLMREQMLLPDIGFCILPVENGKGYATEAAKRLMGYAKGQLGVQGFLGFTSPENVVSRRVLEKLGMEDRGTLRVRWFPGGVEHQVFASKEVGENLGELNVVE